jgi:hypothetical protein
VAAKHGVRVRARSTDVAHARTPALALQANVHLLATCYMRSKEPHRAYAVLKGACVCAAL